MATQSHDIELKLTCEEAALVWECVDFLRITRKSHPEHLIYSLLNKIEIQLGLRPTKKPEKP